MFIVFFFEVVFRKGAAVYMMICMVCRMFFYKYDIYHVLYCFIYIYIYLIYIEFKRNARSVLSKTLYIGWHASGEFVVRTLGYGFEKWCMVS